MPYATEVSERRHIKCTMPRTQLANLIFQTDPNPQIIPSTSLPPSKPTISSILPVETPPESVQPSLDTSNNKKKKKTGFSASTFRGFGCTAQVSLPAVIRTSADWQQSKATKKKNNYSTRGQVVGCQDLWCGPGVGFAAHVAVPTDCLDVIKNGPTTGPFLVSFF